MTVGERIAIRRKELGWTQDELAEKMGYKSKAAISKIETNVNDVTQTTIVKFASVLNTSIVYLMGWDEPKEEENTIKYQVIGNIAAGYDGIAFEEYTGEEVKIPADWIRGRKPSDYFVLRVKGDSMYPAYQDGDFILVKRQATLEHSGQVGVVMYDDTSATLKKVEYVMGEDWMRLVPINPQYPPIMVTDERLEHCRVLGLPKKLIRDINL